ncbi:MAG: linear amide C-N hydrolase [Candidatus Cloacimonetes bacterium]|nr:linear amide C-N hydrolase [Candidatus Cloacimonadota bacterium]
MIILILFSRPCLACSSFVGSSNIGRIFGANLDLDWGDGMVFINKKGVHKSGYQMNARGETAEWTSIYGSVTFNLAGKEFAWSGMNEAGLIISTMWLAESQLPAPDDRYPLVSGFWVQYHLDNHSTIADVLASADSIRLVDDLCHFLVSDNTGHYAVIEYLEGQMIAYPDNALTLPVLTNHPYAAALQIQNGEISGEPFSSSSIIRFGKIAKLLGDFAGKDEKDSVVYAYSILDAVASPDRTQWTIIYVPDVKKVFFRTQESQTYRRLRLNAFDLSCTDPVLILDVNINNGGDISKMFRKYDHNANFSLFYGFTAWWGIEMTAEDAEEFIRYLESFSCQE